jgi:putative transposase
MLLTTSIKLLTSSEDKRKLLKTVYKFNDVCNFISKFCFKNKVYSKIKIQKEIYYQIREQFDLPSQFAIRAISRVAESYKINKKVEHIFDKNSSVEYDQRLLNWKKLDKISILSMDGRLTIPIVFGEYAKLNERVIRNSVKLIYKNKEFYLQAVVEVPEEQLKEIQDFLGVDLGIVNLAATSDGILYSGGQTEEVRKHYVDLRGRLQSVGTKNSKRHLKKLSGKERRFKKNTNHVISKQIVNQAEKALKAIAIEDLGNFKKTVRRDQRDQFGKWAFGELSNFICYKAAIKGIPVIKVDPRNTSITCPKCGNIDKNNRKSQSEFICNICGFSGNADIITAINIAARAAVNQLIAAKVNALSSKPTTLVVGY